MTTSETEQNLVFDYRALRLLIGLIAFALPVVVSLLSDKPLPSISGSYYEEDARDVFVGATFVIGALLFAYNGHTPQEKLVSKGASVAAIITALFPTSCPSCGSDITSIIHYAGAVVLFSTIAYFCLGPFRRHTKEKGEKKERRARIYLVCGLVIIGSMLGVGVAKLLMLEDLGNGIAITYAAEFVSLWAFGVAWIVAGKIIPPLVDEGEQLKLSLN